MMESDRRLRDGRAAYLTCPRCHATLNAQSCVTEAGARPETGGWVPHFGAAR